VPSTSAFLGHTKAMPIPIKVTEIQRSLSWQSTHTYATSVSVWFNSDWWNCDLWLSYYFHFYWVDVWKLCCCHSCGYAMQSTVLSLPKLSANRTTID